MEGIHFVVNDRGEKTAVLIDLHKHRQLWEDLYGRLVSQRQVLGLQENPATTGRTSIAHQLCGSLGKTTKEELDFLLDVERFGDESDVDR